MLVEKIKEACNAINWKFNYGKDHWQNREDYPQDAELPFSERAKYFLLLWKDRNFVINEYGAVTGYDFEAEAVLCVRSKISDEDYNYKYETHISKLEKELEKVFEQFSDCDGWTIKKWREIEVENEYDTNMDGLKIRFTVSYAE